MSLDHVRALVGSHQTMTLSVAVLSGIGMLLIAIRLRRMTAHRATLLVANILTIVAAALATMVSASGMWQFFTDILGPSPLRVVFFAYIEVALLASALLARTRLLRDPHSGSTGVDGVAVWTFATLTATLSALDANSFREVCLRLVAPLIAAWMWERALAAERNARTGRPANRIHWTLTVERIFVGLRLAEAHGRDVTEVDRARRRARLGRTRLNLFLLQARKTPAWRLRRAHHKVIRQAMAAAEHIGLAEFPNAANEREAIQMYMATLYGFVDATSPDAVAHLNAWRSVTGPQPRDEMPVAAYHADTPRAAKADPLPQMRISIPSTRSHRLNGHSVRVDPDDSARRTAALHDRPEDAPRPHQQARRQIQPRDDQPDQTTDALGQVKASSTPEPSPPDQHPTVGDGDRHGEPEVDDGGDTSAVAAMRRYWDAEIATGRIPNGAELSRAAGVPPATGLGRRKRREWEADLPTHLKVA